MTEGFDKKRIPFEFKIQEMGDFGERCFYVKDFEAQSSVRDADKAQIQRTIDKCHEEGGGTVIISSGKWLTGPLRLYDNICLRLEDGAEISFSQKPEDYLPVVFTRWEGMECYNYTPLIYANGCENIKICGKGRLIGGGEAWWHWKKLQGEAAKELCYAQGNSVPVEERIYGTEKAALRPSFIQFIHCTKVCLEDFTIEEGPQWTLHPVYCENVWIHNVTVRTSGPNTDGLNPDSCRNVLIEGCTFSTGDDCIAINSGMNEDGWRVGKPCENVVILNCTMEEGHGAIVIGSGLSGGVHNIYAADCRIKQTMQGIRLKSMRGRGGYIKGAWFENIEIEAVTNEAVQISMFYPYSTVQPLSDVPSDFTDIHLKNITGSSQNLALELRGLPEKKIAGIELSRIKLCAPKAIVAEHVDNVSMEECYVGTCI